MLLNCLQLGLIIQTWNVLYWLELRKVLLALIRGILLVFCLKEKVLPILKDDGSLPGKKKKNDVSGILLDQGSAQI